MIAQKMMKANDLFVRTGSRKLNFVCYFDGEVSIYERERRKAKEGGEGQRGKGRAMSFVLKFSSTKCFCLKFISVAHKKFFPAKKIKRELERGNFNNFLFGTLFRHSFYHYLIF